MFKKIVSFVLVVIVLFLCAFSVSADGYTSSNYTVADVTAAGISNAFDTAGFSIPLLNLLGMAAAGTVSFFGGDNSYCPIGENHLHHSSSANCYGSGVDDYGTYVIMLCEYCGTNFKCYSDELINAYNEAVTDTYGEVTGYSSDGGLIWQTTFGDIASFSFCIVNNGAYLSQSDYPWDSYIHGVYNDVSYDIYTFPYYYHASFMNVNGKTSGFSFLSSGLTSVKFSAPISGTYYLQDGLCFTGSFVPVDDDPVSRSSYYDSTSFSASVYDSGSSISVGRNNGFSRANYTKLLADLDIYFYLPSFKIEPTVSTSGNANYNTGTRIGSINLNLVTTSTVNNVTQIDNVYENTNIIDETNNTFYNPTTNTTYNISNWSYDYSSRTYTGITTDGTPFVVAYLDDLLRIEIGGQTFELHYAVEQEKPPSCDHEYLANERVEPSCLDPGSITYVCRLCGASYSEVLPALGHDYIMMETIPDSYQIDYAILVCPGCNGTDIEASQMDGSEMFLCVCNDCSEEWTVVGTMVAGYDLYRCSRCGAELRDYTHEGVDRSSSAYWSWLQKWLQNFKIWLGDRFDGLGGDDSGSSDGTAVTPVVIAPHGEFKPNATIDIDLGDGEVGATSLLALLGKFAWVMEVWKIGQFVVSTVASDAAYAYEFNYNLGEFDTIESTGDDGVEDLTLDGEAGHAPELVIDFGSASSKYGFNTGGSVKVFDLSWYTPYKQTVDNILSGFLWIFFLWQLFKKTPGIISGSSMDSQKLDDIARGERRK